MYHLMINLRFQVMSIKYGRERKGGVLLHNLLFYI